MTKPMYDSPSERRADKRWEAEQAAAGPDSNPFGFPSMQEEAAAAAAVNGTSSEYELGKILADRQTTHGAFMDNAQIAQALKVVMRDRPGWPRLNSVKQEALDMIVSKIGRILSGDPHHPDHWLDIAGYAQLAAKGG
jgi:Domain of unknown function (DUF6378)